MPHVLDDGIGFHHHKLMLLTGHIQEIEEIPNSQLSKIKLKEFETENTYFFSETLKNVPDPADWETTPVTLGTIEFFISFKMDESAFDGKSGRGILVFEVPTTSENVETGTMALKNFTVREVEPTRFGGTRACSPCTFLKQDNQMVHYKLGDDYYFPIVTFADRENPMGNSYFSFCKGTKGMLDLLNEKATPNYIIGLDDDPIIDTKARVFVHKSIVV